MVIRTFIRCEVCGTVTVVRVQVGWQDECPIRIPCGECGILITGQLRADQKTRQAAATFENAEKIDEPQNPPRFYIETSGEFVTARIQGFREECYTDHPSPFIRATMWMGGPESYMHFQSRAQTFIHLVRNDWSRVRRVTELWLAGRLDLLENELSKIFPGSEIGGPRELDLLRLVHRVWLAFLTPIMPPGMVKRCEMIAKEFSRLMDNRPGLTALTTYFARKGLLPTYEGRLLQLLDSFVTHFVQMVPLYSLQFCTNAPAGSWSGMGLTTASFEDLKDLYIDAYETGTELLTLVVACNNLKHRGRFRPMMPLRKDVANLEDFEARPKGLRLQYQLTETFGAVATRRMKGKIRNAIGHGTWRHDLREQNIIYRSGGTERGGEAQEMHLLDFGSLCWNVCLDVLIGYGELLYQLRRVEVARAAVISRTGLTEAP